MRKKNVAYKKKQENMQMGCSIERLLCVKNSFLPTSFHRSLPDFYRIKQRLRNRRQNGMDSLTSFLQSLLLVPEQKSAEIKIHVKQDANRRIPPGRNPGSGSAR